MNKFIIVMIIFAMSLFPSYADNDIFVKNGIITDESTVESSDDFHKISPYNEYYMTYSNYPYGYQVRVPNNMQMDVSVSKVGTVFFTDNLKAEIYFDPHTSFANYNYYSNLFLRNKKDHHLEYTEKSKISGYTSYTKKWSREKLSLVENDKNHYVRTLIYVPKRGVYTIFLKSSTPFGSYEEYMNIIKSFKITQKSGTPKLNRTFDVSTSNLEELSPTTRRYYDQTFSDSASMQWGMFDISSPFDMTELKNMESYMDYKFNTLIRYHTFAENFPIDDMNKAYDDGRFVELTFQTMFYGQNNDSIMYEILNGKYDNYLNQYAQDIKKFNKPILFRLNNEMNGDWCVYSAYHYSNDTDLYKAFWRYIYEVFEKNSVDNVLWVWNPNDISFPNYKWNHALNYYPGDDYVHIVGLTGYNTGNYYRGEKWRTFKNIYIPLYKEYISTFKQPLMITEFGSNIVGGDRVKWLEDMFSTLETNDFSRIKIAMWWNGIDFDSKGNNARTYRLNGDTASIDVFKKHLVNYKIEPMTVELPTIETAPDSNVVESIESTDVVSDPSLPSDMTDDSMNNGQNSTQEETVTDSPSSEGNEDSPKDEKEKDEKKSENPSEKDDEVSESASKNGNSEKMQDEKNDNEE